VGGNQSETPTISEGRTATLGQSLVAARERRGLSREMVVEQTHIPAHYVKMLEDDDYQGIADQLYLLPFLRRYAGFLEIDQDETAMRLLREVQRIENSPPPVRLDAQVGRTRRHRQRNWTTPILFGALIAVIIGAYMVQSRHSDDIVSAPSLQSLDTAASSAPDSTEAN
jgi:cytoskeleton protein RodZ